jgi:hypothetical protein
LFPSENSPTAASGSGSASNHQQRNSREAPESRHPPTHPPTPPQPSSSYRAATPEFYKTPPVVNYLGKVLKSATSDLNHSGERHSRANSRPGSRSNSISRGNSRSNSRSRGNSVVEFPAFPEEAFYSVSGGHQRRRSNSIPNATAYYTSPSDRVASPPTIATAALAPNNHNEVDSTGEKLTLSRELIESLNISELKMILESFSVNTTNCVDRLDHVALLERCPSVQIVN